EALERLGMMLQQRKGEKAGQAPLEYWTMGYWHRCDACGVYPASERARVGEERDEELLCDACGEKRRRGRQARESRELLPMAESLEEVVGESDRLAVVYGDLNAGGELLQVARQPREVRAFSERLWQTIVESVQQVVKEQRLEWRYQSPIVGGDDAVLFLPASRALGTLAGLWELLEQRVRAIAADPALEGNEELKTRLAGATWSLALVIAPHHLPIPFLFEYAQGLLKSAKRRVYEERSRGRAVSALDFFWITDGTPLSEEPTKLREEFFERRYCEQPPIQKPRVPVAGEFRTVDGLRLTAKPYTKEEFDELRGQAAALRAAGVSRGQLRQLAGLLDQPHPWDAQLDLQYQIARSRIWRDYLATQGVTPDAWLDFFFTWDTQPRVVATTRLLDLLELHELQSLAG
ncbi:MAG: hypothetical protein HY329_23880, partial [Chloroflexi bacterium]|nr:hypothetical protein [Chloroflexota bacterium]